MILRYSAITGILFMLVGCAAATSPIDALPGAIQEQINAAGDNIAQELNETGKDISNQAKTALKEKVNESLNTTARDLQEGINREIERQPGFTAFGLLTALAAASLIRRKH